MESWRGHNNPKNGSELSKYGRRWPDDAPTDATTAASTATARPTTTPEWRRFSADPTIDFSNSHSTGARVIIRMAVKRLSTRAHGLGVQYVSFYFIYDSLAMISTS